MTRALVGAAVLAVSTLVAVYAGPVSSGPEVVGPPPVASQTLSSLTTIAKVQVEFSSTSQAATTPSIVIIVNGTHFTHPLFVRLESAERNLTYGAAAIEHLTPTSLRLEAGTLEPGRYTLSISDAAGQHSNEVPLTIRDK